MYNALIIQRFRRQPRYPIYNRRRQYPKNCAGVIATVVPARLWCIVIVELERGWPLHAYTTSGLVSIPRRRRFIMGKGWSNGHRLGTTWSQRRRSYHPPVVTFFSVRGHVPTIPIFERRRRIVPPSCKRTNRTNVARRKRR